MKKGWNIPRAMELEIENTCDILGDEKHYCHANLPIHLPSECKPNTGHKPGGGRCKDPNHNGGEFSSCCCVGVEILVS